MNVDDADADADADANVDVDVYVDVDNAIVDSVDEDGYDDDDSYLQF
jgi:hypothetical protein